MPELQDHAGASGGATDPLDDDAVVQDADLAPPRRTWTGRAAGPLLALLTYFLLRGGDLSTAGRTTAAVGVLLVPAALAATCAFMLPVATPLNAIVFGSGHVTVGRCSEQG